MRGLRFQSCICVLSILILTGCTGADSGKSPIDRIADIVQEPPSVEPDRGPSDEAGGVSTRPPDVTTVEDISAQVHLVQTKLNQDPLYSFNQEDLAILLNEGLLEDRNELKAWVKE